MKLLSNRSIVPFVVVALLLSTPVLAQDHAAHYVLDAFGGVHAGGGAPVISPATPYFGFDVATDIAYIPVGTGTAQGDGILVLDKWGGVHTGGSLSYAPPLGRTPYFGFDAARAIVYRDIPTRIGFTTSAAGDVMRVSSGTFVPVLTTVFNAPVDGFVHITGQAAIGCWTNSSSFYVVGTLVANINSILDPLSPAHDMGRVSIRDCSYIDGALPTTTVTYSIVLPIARGARFINLLAKKYNGVGSPSDLRIGSRSLTVQFIGPNALGQTTVPGPTESPAGAPSIPPESGRSR